MRQKVKNMNDGVSKNHIIDRENVENSHLG